MKTKKINWFERILNKILGPHITINNKPSVPKGEFRLDK